MMNEYENFMKIPSELNTGQTVPTTNAELNTSNSTEYKHNDANNCSTE